MKRTWAVLAWCYSVDVILVLAVYLTMVFSNGFEWIGELLISLGLASVINVLAGVWAAGLGVLIFYGSILRPPFSDYLHWRGADAHYLRAAYVQLAACSLAIISLFVARALPSVLINNLSFILAFYTLANAVALVEDVYWIIRLNLKFREKMAEHHTTNGQKHED